MKTTFLLALLSSVSSMTFAQIRGVDSTVNISPVAVLPPVVVDQSFSNELIQSVLALTVPFVMVVVIVFLSLKFMTKEKMARYKMIELAIQKGVNIPSQYLYEEKPKIKLSGNLLYSSVRNILIGLVLFFALFDFRGFRFGIWALIISAIGVAQLVVYLTESRKYRIDNTFSSASQDKSTVEDDIVEAEEVNAQDEHIDGQIK